MIVKVIKMKTKIKRNAIAVTINELRNLADELECDMQDKKIWKNTKEIRNQKCDIPIINKTGMSDDWRFEIYYANKKILKKANKRMKEIKSGKVKPLTEKQFKKKLKSKKG